MCFRRKEPPDLRRLIIDGKTLERRNSAEFLGLVIDDKRSKDESPTAKPQVLELEMKPERTRASHPKKEGGL